jgi:hypothetical protein
MLTFALSLLACLPPQRVEAPTGQELRAALDAMRYGKPGETKFDASLASLPTLIASRSAFFVAGGAYLAGQHDRKECIPSLVEALKHENARPETADPSQKRSVLDALIRLDARVPVDIVMTRPELEFITQMYLLLERDTEHGRDGLMRLLDLKCTDLPAHWASAQALVRARDPRIAPWLLAGSDWTFEVRVTDDGEHWQTPICTGIGRSSSDHELWPPRVSYELELPGIEFSDGPIGFKRREDTRSWTGIQRVSAETLEHRRVKLLQHMLGDAPEAELLHPNEHVWFDLPGNAPLEPPLRAHVADLRSRIGRVEAALRRLGGIGEKTVVAPPIFRVALGDYRKQPHAPLTAPAIDGVKYGD